MAASPCQACGRAMADIAEMYLEKCISCGSPRKASSPLAFFGAVAQIKPSAESPSDRGWVLAVIALAYTTLAVGVVALFSNMDFDTATTFFGLLILGPWIIAGGAGAYYLRCRREGAQSKSRISGKALGAFLAYMVLMSLLGFLLLGQAFSSI